MTVDTDQSFIDEDLITAGVLWRLRRLKGLEWQSYRDDYMRMENRMIAADNVASPIKLHSGDVLVWPHARDLVQEGNFA